MSFPSPAYSDTRPSVRARYARRARQAAILGSSIGAGVFTGWSADIAWLLLLPPDSIVMVPNTSVGVMLTGIALWLLSDAERGTRRYGAGRALAMAVLLLGLISFGDRVSLWDGSFIRSYFIDRLSRYPYRPLGLMATNTTLAFMLSGLALLTTDVVFRRRWHPSQAFAAMGLAIGVLALVGHLYGAKPLYAIDRAAGMALITAVAVATLSVGILFARADRGAMALLTGPDLGSVLARRLLPASVLVPLALGVLWLEAIQRPLFSVEGGMALLTLTTIGILLALVLRSAVVVRVVDRERQRVLEREAAARAEAEQLAGLLQQQTVELETQTDDARSAAESARRASRQAQDAADEAATARRDAEVANRAKSDFLAVMSHELRTPLNVIGGYVELLELGVRGPLTNAQREDLARIRRSQQHLLGLINEILNYTRLEAGAMRYDIVPVDASELMRSVEPLVEPLVSAKGLSFARLDGGPPVKVLADPERVRQIFLNLLSNAVKFTPSGGRITMSVQAEGAYAAFRVSDNGVGIPRDKLPSVFEPFVQIDARLTRTEQGIGLGLAISRDLARGMGGDLAAESESGVGSTFTLTLPKAD